MSFRPETPSGGLINRQSFRNGPWKRALEEAGLDDRTPHAMRDTFATLSYAAGMQIEAIAKQMGHVDRDGNPNPATTLRCYAKFLRSVDERNLALLDQYAANSSAAGRKTDGRAEESQQP